MSPLSRRHALAIAGASLLAVPRLAAAQAPWPNRPVRLVVPFAPGGTTDIVGRILAQHLAERLGQPVVVDNRPGGGAMVGSQQVAQAPADGYTLVVSNSASHGISPSLYKTVRYDALADFTHIALIATTSTAVVVNPRFEARSMADIVRLAKARPDGLDFAISGAGTTTHLLGMRFARAAGIKLNPISYRGSGPALNDVIAGVVPLMFDGLPSCIGHIRGGQLRALAVADEQPNPKLPGVPTLAEAGFPNLISYSWFGISGPKGLPAPIAQRLSTEIRAILRLPVVRERYDQLTADAPDSSPEDYARFVRDELANWAEAVRVAGVSAE